MLADHLQSASHVEALRVQRSELPESTAVVSWPVTPLSMVGAGPLLASLSRTRPQQMRWTGGARGERCQPPGELGWWKSSGTRGSCRAGTSPRAFSPGVYSCLSLASPKGPPSLPATWEHLAPTSAGWPDDHGDRPICQTRRPRNLGGRGSAGVPSRVGFSFPR
jgi:hypothetical protein